MPPAASAAGNAVRVVPVGGLATKADFERLLSTRWKCRSAHFAVHHVAGRPAGSNRPLPDPQPRMLSTSPAPECPQPVDDFPGGHWMGCVVPKRHARRAVTRNLIKRQARSAFARHAAGLPAGLWLLRLRAPFDPTAFVSAASPALQRAVRSELDTLLQRALA